MTRLRTKIIFVLAAVLLIGGLLFNVLAERELQEVPCIDERLHEFQNLICEKDGFVNHNGEVAMDISIVAGFVLMFCSFGSYVNDTLEGK